MENKNVSPVIDSPMNLNGCSTCKDGEEKAEMFQRRYVNGKAVSFVQYDYRSKSGELFTCVARDIHEARVKRDLWLNYLKYDL